MSAPPNHRNPMDHTGFGRSLPSTASPSERCPHRRLRLFVAFLVLACGLNCNRREPTQPQAQAQSSAGDASRNPPAPRAASAAAAKPDLGRNLAVARLEPRATVEPPDMGSWDTERLTELANKKLKTLGAALHAGASPSALDTLLTSDSQSNHLFSTATLEVFRDGPLQVERFEPTADLGPLRPHIEQLRDAQQWQQHKFKIIRVTPLESTSNHTFRTTAYVHLSGTSRDDERTVEMNATWDLEWFVQGKEISIRLIRARDVELSTVKQGPIFTDVTEAVLSGTPGFERGILSSVGQLRQETEYQLGVYNLGYHGIAICDVNNDTLPDAYVCQTGSVPNHLYLQNADGTVTDVAQSANVDYLDNTRAALFVDLDNDGDQDLVLTLATGMLILENDGRTRFRERARIRSVKEGFSLTAADFDKDGLLDIYVCVYYGSGSTVSELPAPMPYFDARNGGENHLILNEGDWSFRDTTAEAGLDQDNSRFSFASAWDDFDQDGDLDLLVVNDFGPNQLFRNEKGTFRDCASEAGLVDGAFGMSASFGDFNRDGHSDIYVANMFSAAGNRITTQPQFKPHLNEALRKRFLHLARGNSLFAGNGKQFEDVSVASGVTVGRWSWGSIFADINNDGWQDLLVGNGYVTGESKLDL